MVFWFIVGSEYYGMPPCNVYGVLALLLSLCIFGSDYCQVPGMFGSCYGGAASHF